MKIITIVTDQNGDMEVFDGKAKGSQEWFYAPGLIICKKGSTAKFHDRFCNRACNEAIARSIPAMSLRRIKK